MWTHLFHALLRGGTLAFEWGGGGVNTLLDPQKGTFNLAWGTQEGKKAQSRPPNHHPALLSIKVWRRHQD